MHQHLPKSQLSDLIRLRVRARFYLLCSTRIGDNKRLKSLRNPDNKMSKSEPDSKSRIELLDCPDVIRNKIMKSVTDVTGRLTYEPQTRPGVANLIDIHSALTNQMPEEIETELLLTNKVEYKQRVADLTIELIEPIRQEILRLQADPGYLNGILQQGTDRAKSIASANMGVIKQYVGFSEVTKVKRMLVNMENT